MNIIYLKIDADGKLFAEQAIDRKIKRVYKNKNNSNGDKPSLNKLIGQISTHKISGYYFVGNNLHLKISDIELIICDYERFVELNDLHAKKILSYIDTNAQKLEKKAEIQANRARSILGVVSVSVGLILLTNFVHDIINETQKINEKDGILNSTSISESLTNDQNNYNSKDNEYNVTPTNASSNDEIKTLSNPTPTPIINNDEKINESPNTTLQTLTPPLQTSAEENTSDDLNAIYSKIGNDPLLISNIVLVGESKNQKIINLGSDGMTYYNFKTGTYETSTFDNSDYGKAMEINIKFNYCLKEFKGNIFAALLAYYNGIEEVKERISTEVAPKYGWDYETFLMYETGFRWCIYFSDFPAYNQVESVLSKMPTDYPIQFQMKLDDGNIHFYQAVIKEDISSSYQDVHAYNFVK